MARRNTRTSYTADRSRRFLDALKSGQPREAACAIAGIKMSDFEYWCQKHKDFAHEVTLCENESEARYTTVIAKAAFGHAVVKEYTTTKPVVFNFTDDRGFKQTRLEMVTETRVEKYEEFDWKAALEWLKRRRPERWGDRASIDLDEEIKGLLAELTQLYAQPLLPPIEITNGTADTTH